jgi:hypothetical protein
VGDTAVKQQVTKKPQAASNVAAPMKCNCLCLAAHFNQKYEDSADGTHGRWPAECEITGAKPIYPLEETQACTIDPNSPSHVLQLKKVLSDAEARCSVLRRMLAKAEGRKPFTLDEVMLKVVRATLQAHRIDHDDIENIVGGIVARLGESQTVINVTVNTDYAKPSATRSEQLRMGVLP